jgi:pimeloyl-ACP methyl ester carboxylesterase
VTGDLPARPEGASFREFRYWSRDGLRLFARDYGDAASRVLPVVCLAGLTRTSRDFHTLASYLTELEPRRRIISFDYRGRGESERDSNVANYSIPTETADVLDGMTTLGISRAIICGTSRGGIIGMAIGLTRPKSMAALILNDIGPVLEPEGLARIKKYVGRTPRASDWVDAARIQRKLHGDMFTAFDDIDWSAFARLTYRDAQGIPESDYDPRLAETLSDGDRKSLGLWDQFRALGKLPILVIRGANSDILSAETLQRMMEERPDLEMVTVPDEGHPPQLRVGPLLVRIAQFIKRADSEESANAQEPPVDTQGDRA